MPELDSRHPEVAKITQALATGRVPRDYRGLRNRLRDELARRLADRDVVVAHNVLTMPFNLAAAEALLALDRPLVAWTHDLAWTMARYAAFRRDRSPWSLLGKPQPGCRYVAVSTTRAGEMAAALGLPRDHIEVVANGIDALDFIGVAAGTAKLAARAGMLEADPLILVPTRITPRKRLELAIEVAAVMRSKAPQLRLVVSGPLGAHSPENEGYARALEDLAAQTGCQENVIFMRSLQGSGENHPVRSEDVAGLYRLADLVLLPSESEGFGLVLLESGLARTPVVCAELPVLREVGGAGTWRFNPGADARVVAGLCRRALRTRSARLRRRARKSDWRRVLPRIEGVLEAAVRG